MDFPGSFSDHILPEKIHAINVSFLVPEMRKSYGGTAGNIAYSLGLLGMPVVLLGCVGKDFPPYGEYLSKVGVNIDQLIHDDSRYCSTAVGITDKKDNQIWGFYPGADEQSHTLSVKHMLMRPKNKKSVHNKSVSREDFAIIAPHNPKTMMKFAHEYFQENIPYLFDPGMQLRWLTGDDLRMACKGARIIIGNDYEVAVMEKAMGISDLHHMAKGQTIVITTLGEEGSKVSTEKGTTCVSAVMTTRVVDPSGAGDAYRSGFMAGYLRGYSTEICARMGSLAAAYAVESFGTTNHLFTKEEFLKRYTDIFGESVKL